MRSGEISHIFGRRLCHDHLHHGFVVFKEFRMTARLCEMAFGIWSTFFRHEFQCKVAGERVFDEWFERMFCERFAVAGVAWMECGARTFNTQSLFSASSSLSHQDGWNTAIFMLASNEMTSGSALYASQNRRILQLSSCLVTQQSCR